MRVLLTAVIAALAFAASAAAAPISVQPLRDAGYAVGLASDSGNGCTTWAVSGHGVSTYVNDCDADASTTIASLTDPALIFERDWQLNHSDQVQAAQTIGNHCYSISRTAPATDSWRIVGGTTDTTVAGDQLPGLAGSLPDLHQPDGSCSPGTVVAVVPSGTGDTVTVPGAPTVTTAIQTQAQAIIAAQEAAAAAVTAAARPTAVADANTAASDAWSSAVDQGFAAVDAALAARSAGLNALYGLDVAPA